MEGYKGMRLSLFDQLGQNIDIDSGRMAEAPQHPPNTPAQRTPELQDVEAEIIKRFYWYEVYS